MKLLEDRRVLLAGGAALALVAGLGVAALIVSRDHGSKAPPPASTGGLVLKMGQGETRLDPAKPLRCFVDGQFVGEATLADCAKKNGISTEALDVGVDQTGALAAGQGDASITPLPQQDVTPPVPDQPPVQAPTEAVPTPAPARNQTGACVREVGGESHRVADDLTLSGCVRFLFGNRCAPPGTMPAGRWLDLPLRLNGRRVEIASDGRTFRPLTDQAPGTCAVAPF